MGSEERDDSDGSDEPDFELTTARLRLRRPRLADACAIAALANDWEVARNLSRVPHPYEMSDAQEFIGRARQFAWPQVALAITRQAGGEILGMCGLEDRGISGDFEIGYWLGRGFWGQGFATEAAHALVDHAFTRAGLDRVAVTCRVTNAASRRVIHKCGFQPEGSDMISSIALGGAVPVECYSLDRATWRALRAWRREESYEIS